MKKNFVLMTLLTSLASPVYADIIIDPCDSSNEGDACTMDHGTAGKCSENLICTAIAEDDDDSCATTNGTSSLLTVLAGLALVSIGRLRR